VTLALFINVLIIIIIIIIGLTVGAHYKSLLLLLFGTWYTTVATEATDLPASLMYCCYTTLEKIN